MTRRELLDQIALWRENLIDLDTVVDDKRQVYARSGDDHDREALVVAEGELERGQRHLAHLMAMYDELSESE